MKLSQTALGVIWAARKVRGDVASLVARQELKGLHKYGQTLDQYEVPLGGLEAMTEAERDKRGEYLRNHLLEELIDGLMYSEALIGNDTRRAADWLRIQALLAECLQIAITK